MVSKSKLVNCFLIVLLTWIFIFVLFITWLSQGHSDMKPTCEEVLSNDIEDTPDIRKTIFSHTKSKSTIIPSLRQIFANPVEIERNDKNIITTPTLEFEVSRRRSHEDVTELWFYLKDSFKYLQHEENLQKLRQKLDEMLKYSAAQKNLILSDIDEITQSDQLKTWRIKEHLDLSELIQTRLRKLQNPRNCETVKKIRCDLKINCGFGCKIHHLVFCLIMAYGTQRTLIFDDEYWGFEGIKWNSIFQPISNCSFDSSVQYFPYSNGIENLNRDFFLPIIGGLSTRPSFLPLSIPEELAPRLIRLHGDPIVWWVGQFLKYLMRAQSTLQFDMDATEEKIKFERPIVGIHVRRTDKIGTEADFHELDEYMIHVDEYFDYVEMRNGKNAETKRNVYLASDDPKVFSEAKNSYPRYNFLGDDGISESASPKNRRSQNSLRGIIFDVYFLSKCDFIVCTFSSQVCRVAYELMQTRNPDAASNFRSLDDIYYFAGQHDHDYEVILQHTAENADELDLRLGDRVHVLGNHWNGYSKGIVRRTNEEGLFPTHKARNIIRTDDFPKYRITNDDEEFDWN